MKKYWFKSKEYGWGWYPSSTEGFLVLSVYLIALSLLVIGLINTLNSQMFLTAIVFEFLIISLTALLLTMCFLKGEKPSWRWGKKTKRR